jgi:hypothetical protein
VVLELIRDILGLIDAIFCEMGRLYAKEGEKLGKGNAKLQTRSKKKETGNGR